MPVYRLIIERHGRLLGHFESSTPDASQSVRDLAASLPASEGYRLQTQVAEGERRVLEVSPKGVRLLAVEPLFAPAALDLTMQPVQD